MNAPELRLVERRERAAVALRPSWVYPVPAFVAGIVTVWSAWGWRAALGAGGVYLLALAWKWVAEG